MGVWPILFVVDNHIQDCKITYANIEKVPKLI